MAGAYIYISLVVLALAVWVARPRKASKPDAEKPDAEMVFLPCPAGCGRVVMVVKDTAVKCCLHCWLESSEAE